jgi:anti-anti-sigma regulatory factor
MPATTPADEDRPTTFTVRCGPGPSAPTNVAVDGVLSVDTSTGFRAVLADITSDRDVTFDLGRCRFVDDVGVNALAGAAARIRSRGGRVATVNVPLVLQAALEQALGLPRLLQPA